MKQGIHVEKLPRQTCLPNVSQVLVQTPKGSRNAYGLDEVTGLWQLNRYVFTGKPAPGDIAGQTLPTPKHLSGQQR